MNESTRLRIIDLLIKYSDICCTMDGRDRVEKYRQLLVLMVDSYIGRDRYSGCIEQIDDYIRVVDVLRDQNTAAISRLNSAVCTYDRYIMRT